ncbi:hypothetical protein, conserved [Trypanosoma brucei gambiense DAL972]|uniref:Uncharacterized protein n=1 Tax=Trypanosoma brucei gambiense (strain MHOM/CI/86/DAL972) TaxID=679716 RepID=C9ZVD0_TRYB9|nr:hypothetical protein, conserved [Trypanosoma brucei gambiense DAL972]CBH13368.1 hypothetical protein, conserved [Trypanosoma brucei gambiense DAL972]|eukprot:XP_011775645.1 hypothetical protein, conserved [Trypanosoma brucei gambiense DAL972]
MVKMPSNLSDLFPLPKCSVASAVELTLLIGAVAASTYLAVANSVWRVYCGLTLVLFAVYCLRLWRLLPGEKEYLEMEAHKLADHMMVKQREATATQQTLVGQRGHATNPAQTPALQHSHFQGVNPILGSHQLQQLASSLALSQSQQFMSSMMLPHHQQLMSSVALPPLQISNSLPIPLPLQQLANSMALSQMHQPQFHAVNHMVAPQQHQRELITPRITVASPLPTPSVLRQFPPTTLRENDGEEPPQKSQMPYGDGHLG